MAKEMSEEEAISRLEGLVKGWPKHLWLYSADGHMYVMRRCDNGEKVYSALGSPDPETIAATIYLPADGGDW